MSAASVVGTRGALRPRHLAALSIGTFALGIDGFVLSGLLPQVAASLHVPTAAAGQLTTLFALVYAVGSPVIATATGNWDRRRLLLLGMVVFAVGVGLQAVGPTFAVVAAGRAIAALGAAAFQATAYGTAGLLSDDEHRPRTLAVVAGGSSVAIVAGLPFGILVGQVWGWRGAMVVLLALAVVTAVSTSMLPSVHAPRLLFRQRVAVLRDGRVLRVLIGTVLVMTPGFLVLAFVPIIVTGTGNWTVILVLAYGVGQVAGTAVAPRVIRWMSARLTVAVAAVLVLVGCVALGALRSAPVGAAVAMAVLGIGVGLAVVPQQARLFTTVPRIAAVAVGLNGSAIYCGSALGAALGGVALTFGGAEALAFTAAAIALVATVAVVALKVERPERDTPLERGGRED
ncbi:MFS transporter [Curtobacterium sp. SGAir0471]|uniref:MFS transporter n=1 Tax=Curtobacterium sp. SGAir0471 TaxID=2070337 RepID=UPI0010CCCC13|nr:MFS transporter [Curtobacterium sp. SGAir0471]QCR43468.1 MFS transporter [Curtobacterium sp. SGAir0471]